MHRDGEVGKGGGDGLEWMLAQRLFGSWVGSSGDGWLWIAVLLSWWMMMVWCWV